MRKKNKKIKMPNSYFIEKDIRSVDHLLNGKSEKEDNSKKG